MKIIGLFIGIAFLAKLTFGTIGVLMSQKETDPSIIAANVQVPSTIDSIPASIEAYCVSFAQRKEYINEIQKSSAQFFPTVNEVFLKEGVPTDLNVLIALESTFKKDLISSAGAVGYWQFLKETALEYGLKVDSNVDERKDFKKSTIAAAKYLKKHFDILKDWNLAIAAYNCGLGNVLKAIKKSNSTNSDFFTIKEFLPKETQNYVLKYIALNTVLNNYTLYLQDKMQWTNKIIS